MVDAPFAVDGAVGREKLDELMAVGTEYAELDYKAELDLRKGQDKHRVDFASDVAALSSLPNGGYIVIGVDGRGNVAADNFLSPDPEQYDEAKLREIVQTYVDGQIRLAVQLHAFGDRRVAVVYVGSSRDALPPVMRREGKYSLPSGATKVAFRDGDVFVRDGTSSRRIRHTDWVRLLENFRSRVRGEAASDTQDVVSRLAEMLRGGNAPVVVDVAMAPGDFEEAVHAAIAAGDIAPLRRALHQAVTVRRDWTDPHRAAEVEVTLDRVVAIAAVAVEQDNHVVFGHAIDTL